MDSASKADGGDAGDDGRADPAGGDSTAFDQVAGDTQGLGRAEEEEAGEFPEEDEGLRPPSAVGRTRGRTRGRAQGCAGVRGWGQRGVAANARERVRSGPWRERHGRPEVVPEEGIADRPAAADIEEEEEAHMASEEGESEEVSLDDEPGVGNHQGNARSGRSGSGGNGRAGEEQQHKEAPNEAPIGQPAGAEVRDMRSPEVIARDENIRRQVAEWEVDCQQSSEKPFLARRMSPGVVDSFAACLVIPL
ncbi:unnamed protein product [Closterium sp. NIES-64]|nr:unnamed protein product [Closterium sp. NIES-64]